MFTLTNSNAKRIIRSTTYLALGEPTARALRGHTQTLDLSVPAPNRWDRDIATMRWIGIGLTGIGKR